MINTLFSTELATGKDHTRRHTKQLDKTVEIDIIKAELEEKQFKVKLTVIDTPGFGDYVNNRDSWTPIVDFIDDQHELYMRQEQQPERNEKTDLRVHACLYFIRPTGHTLKPLDIEIMKRLGTRVNLIPVVAKADTLTPNDLAVFKQRVSIWGKGWGEDKAWEEGQKVEVAVGIGREVLNIVVGRRCRSDSLWEGT